MEWAWNLANSYDCYSKDVRRPLICLLLVDFGLPVVLISEQLYGHFNFSKFKFKDLPSFFTLTTYILISFAKKYDILKRSA